MLTNEQAQQIKQQLIQHIKETFPENKKQSSIDRIVSMSNQELFDFIQKNNLIMQQKNTATEKIQTNKNQETQCIVCSIISGQIPSYKIDENKYGLAVLEINPISKGHSMVLPKKHIVSSKDIPQQCFSLAKKTAKKIKSKLKPKDILISTRDIFGHQAIDIIPIYNSENANSPRYKAPEQELKKLQELLKFKPKQKQPKLKTKKISNKENIKLPKRIP